MAKAKKWDGKLASPKLTLNEQPYEPEHNYECSGSHVIGSTKPVAECPIYVRGEKCHGSLTPFGRGSRS